MAGRTRPPLARCRSLVPLALVARRLRRRRAARHARARRVPRRRRSTTSSSRCSSSPAVVFVLVQGGVLFLAWRFRKRKDDDDSLPPQVHGNIKLEIGWTILPALAARGRRRRVGAHPPRPRRDAPEDAMQVTVVGQQWWWEYQLRRRRRRRGRHRHRQRPGDPRRRADRARHHSRATSSTRSGSPRSTARRTPCPGATHPLTIEADEPGVFRGQCTEFCGLSHAYMRMRVVALSEADYEAWAGEPARGRGGARPASWPRQGMELFRTTCSRCHLVTGPGGNEDVREEDGIEGAALVAGAAPNLTHFASRGVFAGAIFDLWVDQRRQRRGRRRRDRRGAATSPTSRRGCATRRPRSRWPRTRQRGMPDLDLTEEQIDALVAYLRDAGVAAAWRSSNDPPTPWRCRPAAPCRAQRPRRVRPAAGQDGVALVGQHRRPQEDRHHVRRLGAVLPRHRRHRGPGRSASQLAAPGQKLLSADLYNQVFTMHGITMIFLVVMPLGAAFMNYLIPLQIGARDVAFPRLNALSFWTFLVGGIFLNTSWFLGGGADGGWFAYAPNTGVVFSPEPRHGLLRHRPADHRHRLARRCRQPGRHRAQPAGAGHDAHEDAGVHLDEPRHPGPAGVRHAGHLGGAVPAHLRPAVRRQLLQRAAAAPTRCCGSTCSGSSAIPRSTS